MSEAGAAHYWIAPDSTGEPTIWCTEGAETFPFVRRSQVNPFSWRRLCRRINDDA